MKSFLAKHKSAFALILFFLVLTPVLVSVAPERVEAQMWNPVGYTAYGQLIVKAAEVADSFDPIVWINKFLNWLLWLLTVALGWGIAIAQWVFAEVLTYSITEFYKLANVAKVGWASVRDIANVFFIFILLWVAIQTVLGVSSNTKKLILQVVMAALLINFSGVIARVVIDSGNVMTLMFWESAKGKNNSIGDRIMNGVRLVKVTSLTSSPPSSYPPVTVGDPAKAEAVKQTNPFSIMVQGFAAVAMMLIVFILFLTMAILFLRRAIWLVFLILMAPSAFLVYAFSGFSGWAKSWWEKLVCQTFFAPVFMVIFAVSITVVEGAGSALFDSGEPVTLPAQLIFFIVACTLMYVSLIAANSLGCTGSTAIAQWAGKKMTAMGTNSAAWLGRNTLGRGAAAVANTGAVRRLAASNVPIIGGASRAAFGGLKGVAETKFGGSKGFLEAQKADKEAKVQLGKDIKTGIGVSVKSREREDLQKKYLATLESQGKGQKMVGAGTGAAVGGALAAILGGPVSAVAVGAAAGGLAGRKSIESEAAAKDLSKEIKKEEDKDLAADKKQRRLADLTDDKDDTGNDRTSLIAAAREKAKSGNKDDIDDLRKLENEADLLRTSLVNLEKPMKSLQQVAEDDKKKLAESTAQQNKRGVLSRGANKLKTAAAKLGVTSTPASTTPPTPPPPGPLPEQERLVRDLQNREQELSQIRAEITRHELAGNMGDANRMRTESSRIENDINSLKSRINPNPPTA